MALAVKLTLALLKSDAVVIDGEMLFRSRPPE